MPADQDPGVGGVLRRPVPGQDFARQRWHGPRQGRELLEDDRPVGRVGRPEEIDLGRAQALGQPQAQGLVGPVARELQGHQPAPDQAVGGPPGRWLIAEQLEFQRQGAAGIGEEAVHALGVGQEHGLGVGAQMIEVLFRQAIEAEGAHQAVDLDGGRSQALGEPPGAEAAHEVHLHQTVLGMGVAERAIGVEILLGPDGHQALLVTQHLDRRRQARQPHLALQLGQGAAQPEEAGDQGDDQQGGETAGGQQGPFQPARHGRDPE